MSEAYITDKTFKGIDFTQQKPEKGDYENCAFINCRFPNVDLSEINFIECVFENCDIGMSKIYGTTFRDIQFKGCKLIGLHFEQSNDFLFSVDFEACNLSLSSFYQMKLKKTSFRNCDLQEVDFIEADLTSSVFSNCDLGGALFQNTVLIKADLQTAYNFSIDSESNRIEKAKFSLNGLPGLLDKYDLEIG